MISPCKECICYAICVSRKYIHCELLYNYARAYTETDKEFWSLMRKIVPKCDGVSKDGKVAICSRTVGASGVIG